MIIPVTTVSIPNTATLFIPPKLGKKDAGSRGAEARGGNSKNALLRVPSAPPRIHRGPVFYFVVRSNVSKNQSVSL